MMWSGDGGSAGMIIFRARKINGKSQLGHVLEKEPLPPETVKEERVRGN